MKRFVIVWILLVWAAALTWAGRHAMLDDALIHLRYASVLHDKHFISYDGVHPTYGASSLLYVVMLALLRTLTTSPLLPKIVSVFAYAGLLVLACRLVRTNRFALALIAVLVSPMAVRWLTDGMETSLVCVFAIALPIMLHRRSHPVILALMACLLSMLRVELAVLAVLSVLLMVTIGDRVRALALALGAASALAGIAIGMGHLLPDTAVAKVGLASRFVLSTAAYELVASLSFGCGAFLLWIVSAMKAWRANWRLALIANLPLPLILLLATIRGQQIHGIRYLIWELLFSITWNLLATRTDKTGSNSTNTADQTLLRPAFIYSIAGLLVLIWAFELPIALRIDQGRSRTLSAMSASQLEKLRGEGVAGDVGFIGYFSQAPICDINGLVDGRTAAQMSLLQRAEACVATHPSFLFLADRQMADAVAAGLLDVSDWEQCGSVTFRNVNSDDRHWLLVRKLQYPNGCPVHLPDQRELPRL